MCLSIDYEINNRKVKRFKCEMMGRTLRNNCSRERAEDRGSGRAWESLEFSTEHMTLTEHKRAEVEMSKLFKIKVQSVQSAHCTKTKLVQVCELDLCTGNSSNLCANKSSLVPTF